MNHSALIRHPLRLHPEQSLIALLEKIARQFPPQIVPQRLLDVPRAAYQIAFIQKYRPGLRHVCDIGGGISLFPLGCAALGIKTRIVDNFLDQFNHNDLDSQRERLFDAAYKLQDAYGVQRTTRDCIIDGLGTAPDSLDVVTTFDSLEHWHHSPKKLFAEVMRSLTSGGLFFIGVPNNVNLRKRLTVPFGYGKWSGMEAWYEKERFVGHVREPDAEDLDYIARDMGLKQWKIFGMNWIGYINKRPFIRFMTPWIDMPLRFFPTLCADLYCYGYKMDQSKP